MKSVIKDASTRPFIDNAQMLCRKFGVSSIIVVGASGEYFKIADRVVLVDKFVATEYTDYEKAPVEAPPDFNPQKRSVNLTRLRGSCQNRDITIPDNDTIKIGAEKIKATDIIPNATRGQLAFIGCLLYHIAIYGQQNKGSLPQIIETLYRKIELDIGSIIQATVPGLSSIEYVRKYDIMGLMNRMRIVDFTKQ